ncbi:hypothetical protein RINTHH_5620 [Richelia intracellularis HH01]|uniref:Uncharacterized protein n=1 Tax=Richelia intracellularis HH01 TaxID=1165094 RepID=M1WY87_9NOST|nr:hypothetical protein [Richelia intracellularis]CCH66717.1 hypothetical protein RINTHH_5620 [Richelia intracellularis HH01]
MIIKCQTGNLHMIVGIIAIGQSHLFYAVLCKPLVKILQEILHIAIACVSYSQVIPDIDIHLFTGA